ncbi:MAG: TonB-dependent receptor [Rhodocyclaceae bacterium]|nr:MAG: TonB-dependent receptor [Rhodocyclaceae bacterium]
MFTELSPDNVNTPNAVFPQSKALYWAISVALLPCWAQAEQRIMEAPTVEVIGESFVPGLGVPKSQVASNVQSFSGEDMRHAQAPNLPAFMADTLPSVSANSVTGNPLQVDLAYRGFYASPLMGMPQGLSVYLDGMRMNESFGDTVLWDLIPRNAVAGANLLAGANPVFGLNALGGALNMGTKSGETHPGTEAELTTGSHGYSSMSASHGGAQDGYGWFIAANTWRDGGWRDSSPSNQDQVFAKVGKQVEDGDVDLSFALSQAKLSGNGLTPDEMLSDRRGAVYTHGDETRNRAWHINLQASRELRDGVFLSGNAYVRQTRMGGINPDVNQITDDRFGIQPYEDTGNAGEEASVNRQRLEQQMAGLNLQATLEREEGRRYIFGYALESGRADYKRSYQLGSFDASRGVVPLGVETNIVDVSGTTTSHGLFAVWHETLRPGWQMTASARWNQTRVKTTDHLFDPANPVIIGSQGLANDFTYRRLNPAFGLTWEAAPAFTAYGSLGQTNRAPSPIELACADANAPCTLPNAMQSDPYLKQVVTTNLEGGLRGRFGDKGHWNAGLFRADNRDDILFVATTTSSGYFQNFGRTRRQGLELGLDAEQDKLAWNVNYSLVDATYQSEATVASPANSQADANGNIQVRAGNTIPGIPRHQLKLGVTWKPADGTRLGLQVVAFSSQYARGNENNAHQSDGVSWFGPGVIPGYTVLNLTGETPLTKGLTLFGRVNNLFDKHYETAGQLGENAFVGGAFNPVSAAWRNESFLAPGAPRTVFVGLRYRL